MACESSYATALKIISSQIYFDCETSCIFILYLTSKVVDVSIGLLKSPSKRTASALTTQWCKFLSQEVRENRAIFVALPREFPLSICATFTRKFQIITQNYTPLSML